MTHTDHNMLESILRRIDQIAATIEIAASNDDSTRGPAYRLCADLLTEQSCLMDEVLHPRGGK